jgi:hypothetical protein
MLQLFSVRPLTRERAAIIEAIGKSVQDCARAAAAPVTPGETVKPQYDRACRRLGYQASKSDEREFYDAWYGRAGTWQGPRLVEFIQKFSRFVSNDADPCAREAFDRLTFAVFGGQGNAGADGVSADRVRVPSNSPRDQGASRSVAARAVAFVGPFEVERGFK